MTTKILVVDDGLERKLISHILKKYGYEVVEAGNGAEGLELASSLMPDLILLDILMPKLDGYEVYRLLQNDPQTAAIPVIFLTGMTDAEDKVKGLEMGAVDYITKPFDPGEVLARVRTHIKIHTLTKELLNINKELVEKQNQLDEDLKAAALIQHSLLPRSIMKIRNLDLAWLFNPCDHMGGDIFNILHLDEQRIAFYMIDVSGHGVPSALITVSITQMLQQQVDYHNNSECLTLNNNLLRPSELLQMLDKEYPIERFDKYFTMAYMVLDVSNGRLTYSIAGHPPPVLLGMGGEIELLQEGGTIIGLGGIVPFAEGEKYLRKGDKIIIYTDGVVERQNEVGEFYGEDRFFDLLRNSKNFPIKSTIDKIFSTVINFGNNEKLLDDISLLGFEYKGENI
jgi:phosphoserine phosphatase RsbU/P